MHTPPPFPPTHVSVTCTMLHLFFYLIVVHDGCSDGCSPRNNIQVARITAAQRDMGLDLFHALGKILYNKRGAHAADDDCAGDLDEDGGRGGAARSRGGVSAGGSGGSSSSAPSMAAQQLQAAALRAGQQWMVQRADVKLPPRWVRVEARVSQAGAALTRL